MFRLTVLVAFVAAVALALVTKDWPTPPQQRVHVQGRRFLVRPAGPAPEAPSGAEAPAGGDVEPDEPEGPADDVPEEPAVELKTVTDVDLCLAPNAVDPPFRRSCEIHVGIEGNLSWHAGGQVAEMSTLRAVRSGLDQKFDVPDVVLVPDRLTNWQEIRFLTLACRQSMRGRLWLGAARSVEEPETLRVLPFPQSPTPDVPLPTGDVFRVTVEDADGEAVHSVNGERIEGFPAGLALAWNEWREAHPDADTSSPASTPVILEAHRFVPCHMVLAVVDVLRGLGIEAERLDGKLGRMRK